VFADPRLVAIGGATATINFWRTTWSALLVLYAVRDLGMSPAAVGVTYALGSVGGLLGAQLASPFDRALGPVRTIALTLSVSCAFALLLPLAVPGIAAFLLLSVSQIGMEAANVSFGITTVSFRQVIVPDRLIGRVSSVMKFASWGVAPTLGALVGGLLGTLLPLRAAVAIGVVGGLSTGLWFALPWLAHQSWIHAVADEVPERAAENGVLPPES